MSGSIELHFTVLITVHLHAQTYYYRITLPRQQFVTAPDWQR